MRDDELNQIAKACGIPHLTDVRRDWRKQYRTRLRSRYDRHLPVELRTLIGEVAPSVRIFNQRLQISYSMLLRDLRRIDLGMPVRWSQVERILEAAELPAHCDRWTTIHGLWKTAANQNGRR